MAERYCTKHGKYLEGWSEGGCPECSDEAKQSERDRERAACDAEEREEASRRREEAAQERDERAAERADERAYLINNPGEYDCPHCMLKSLKRGATRCPKCQGIIEGRSWLEVYAREEKARKEREEACLRAEEARLRAEEARVREKEAARKTGHGSN